MTKNIKKHIYYLKGTHCVSCEILIEKKLSKINNINSVQVSTNKGEVIITYYNKKPSLKILNSMFKNEGYVFSDQPQKFINNFRLKDFFISISIGLLIILGFISLDQFGLSGLINVSSHSSLIVFFIFGIVAGVSSCVALVGGLILSMSKQWIELYAENDSTWKKLQPNFIFNIGRLIAYGILGAILAVIGNKLNFSLHFGPILVIFVSIMMIFLSFQMFDIKIFNKFRFSMPKFITKFITNESNFKGKYMPFIMGAFTFFLPCGFTITVQGLALISGSAIQGGLIMFLFALGTLPTLLLIGLSSVKFTQNPNLTNKFLKVAGILVLFFALYNINFQLNVLGIFSLSDLNINSNELKEDDFSPIIDGKQILEMDALAYSYSPNYFQVQVGVPVRWEVIDKGISGCTNAIISRNLFEGEFPLILGDISIKEFTPTQPGKYKFSCWMGMVSGIIEVVDENENILQNNTILDYNDNICNFSSIDSLDGVCGLNDI